MSRPREIAKRLVRLAAQPFGTITQVVTSDPAVALTFDDGPDPDATPRLLDVLGRHGARATFFMVGKRAARHPEIVERVAAEGHTVASHGWDHSSFALISGRWRRAQLRWCQEALAPHGAPLFRPPFGHQSVASHLDAWRLGYQVVAWNLGAEDYRGEDAETLAERVKRGLRPGSIVLLHDGLCSTSDLSFCDREPTIRAIDLLLEERASTFRFVTVPELLRMGRASKWPWYRGADMAALRAQL